MKKVLLQIVLISMALTSCYSIDEKLKKEFHSDRRELEKVVTLIKKNDLCCELQLKGGKLWNLKKQTPPLNSTNFAIERTLGIKVEVPGNGAEVITFEYDIYSLRGYECSLIYFSPNSRRDMIFRSNNESSRMKIEILDRDWVLYIEKPNIGK